MVGARLQTSRPSSRLLALRAGNDVLRYDDDPKVVIIIDGLTSVVDGDPRLLARVLDAYVHVLAAKGIAPCPPTVPADAPTTVPVVSCGL